MQAAVDSPDDGVVVQVHCADEAAQPQRPKTACNLEMGDGDIVMDMDAGHVESGAAAVAVAVVAMAVVAATATAAGVVVAAAAAAAAAVVAAAAAAVAAVAAAAVAAAVVAAAAVAAVVVVVVVVAAAAAAAVDDDVAFEVLSGDAGLDKTAPDRVGSEIDTRNDHSLQMVQIHAACTLHGTHVLILMFVSPLETRIPEAMALGPANGQSWSDYSVKRVQVVT